MTHTSLIVMVRSCALHEKLILNFIKNIIYFMNKITIQSYTFKYIYGIKPSI